MEIYNSFTTKHKLMVVIVGFFLAIQICLFIYLFKRMCGLSSKDKETEKKETSKKLVIGIGHKFGVGKDTMLSHLVSKYKFHEGRFAYRLKVICSEITETTLKQNFDQKDFVIRNFSDQYKITHILIKHLSDIYPKYKIYWWESKFLKSSAFERLYCYFLKSEYSRFTSFLSTKIILPFPKEKGLTLGKLQQILGNAMRKEFDEDIFIKLALYDLKKLKANKVAFPDMRFPNEVEMIKSIGGTTIRIIRPWDFRKGSANGRNRYDITETSLMGPDFDFSIENDKINDKNDFYEKIDIVMKDISLLHGIEKKEKVVKDECKKSE